MKYSCLKFFTALPLVVGLVLGNVVLNSDLVRAVEQGSGLTLAGSPEAPKDLVVKSIYPLMRVDLSWSPVSNTDYYVVYRSETNSFAGLDPIGRTTIATTTYIDGVPTTNTYYYKVAGRNTRGEGYNSDVASTSTCIIPSSLERDTEGGRVVVVETKPIPEPVLLPQSPLPNYGVCPGVKFERGGVVIVSDAEKPEQVDYQRSKDFISKIIFKNVPKSDQIFVEPGKNLKFEYTWTNAIDKNKLKNPNRKFLIRRRLWDSRGNKVLEKSYPHIIYPGKSKNIAVSELVKKDLPSGEYTVEVEIIHYIPYQDEEDIVVDRNSFKFMVR